MVGINTAVAGMGLGLAVPVNPTTHRIIAALLHDGRVRRAYLGLVSSPAPLPAAWAERTGQRTALRVVEVVEGSPAALSGLRRGDMVLALDTVPLGDAQSLQRRLFAEAIGTRVEITVLRNGALVDVVAEPAGSATRASRALSRTGRAAPAGRPGRDVPRARRRRRAGW